MGTINLKDPSVPIREARLGSITGFNGRAKDLVECSHSKKLNHG